MQSKRKEKVALLRKSERKNKTKLPWNLESESESENVSRSVVSNSVTP